MKKSLFTMLCALFLASCGGGTSDDGTPQTPSEVTVVRCSNPPAISNGAQNRFLGIYFNGRVCASSTAGDTGDSNGDGIISTNSSDDTPPIPAENPVDEDGFEQVVELELATDGTTWAVVYGENWLPFEGTGNYVNTDNSDSSAQLTFTRDMDERLGQWKVTLTVTLTTAALTVTNITFEPVQ